MKVFTRILVVCLSGILLTGVIWVARKYYVSLPLGFHIKAAASMQKEMDTKLGEWEKMQG